jgi:hypothetical protein
LQIVNRISVNSIYDLVSGQAAIRVWPVVSLTGEASGEPLFAQRRRVEPYLDLPQKSL